MNTERGPAHPADRVKATVISVSIGTLVIVSSALGGIVWRAAGDRTQALANITSNANAAERIHDNLTDHETRLRKLEFDRELLIRIDERTNELNQRTQSQGDNIRLMMRRLGVEPGSNP